MQKGIKTISFGGVNCYLVKTAKGFILIDTGGPTISDADWMKGRGVLQKELDSSGCVPGNLILIIITHGDTDHIWNCVYLREKYNTKIIMHKEDSIMVEKGIMKKRKFKSFFQMIKIIIPLIAAVPKLMKLAGQFEKFSPDLYIDDGFVLSEYGFNAEIVYIPGHTKGSIGIITEERELFCGDALANIKKPEILSIAENFDDLFLSIEKLNKLHLKTVYPGHGKSFQMELFHKKSAKKKRRENE